MSTLLSGIGIAAMSRRLRVETISDLEAFRYLKPAWDDLVAAAGVDHPFMGHEWLHTWWQCFGEQRPLHIVVAREGDAIVGIAPMMEDRERLYGFRLRKLSLMWNPHVPRCDFIVRAQRTDVYKALWEHIAAETRQWDLVLLPQLPEGSPTLTVIRELASASGFLVGMWTSDAAPYLNIAGTWKEYFESLPRKHRSNVRNRLRRLRHLGNLELESFSAGSEDVSAALEEGFRLEAAAWKGANGTAVLSDPKTMAFYSRLATTGGVRESVHLHFLKCGGRRIAFDFSMGDENSTFLVKGGYLPDYARYSPFNTMTALNLEQCFHDRLERFDFLGSQEDWKARWSGRVLQHHWMFIYPNNPRTALFHAMKFRLSPMIKEFRQVRDRDAARLTKTSEAAH